MPAPLPTYRTGATPGLIVGNGSMQASVGQRMARMETFGKVKPICVALMGIAAQPPTSYSQHAKLIDSLSSSLSTASPSSLDPAVINYVLFPVTNIMRQSNPANLPDSFLEAAFGLLSLTTKAWRRCPGGMELVAWQQLWRFCIAAVGPRLGDKGKGKEVSQEVQLRAVELLSALLSPPRPDEHGTPHPTPSMLATVSTAKSPLLPTLFQTITFLLETASPAPPHHRLQLSSLRLLRPLISVYLVGKHEVLAAVLPGSVSSMAKLVQSQATSLKGEAAKEVAGVLEEVIAATLNDGDLRHLGLLRPKVDDLSQLAEEWEATGSPISPDQPPPPSPASSTSSAKSQNPFPPLSASYLSFTSTQLAGAIPPILLSLSAHPSDLARHAVISLTTRLIQQCTESLPLLLPRSLATLLLLSSDAFDPVKQDAKWHIRSVLDDPALQLDLVMLDLLNNAINSLPRLVTSQQDLKVDELARLITAIADVAADSGHHDIGRRRNPIAELLGPSGGVEKWSWSLLDCFEFGKPTGWSAYDHGAARAAQLGWERHSTVPGGVPLLMEGREAASAASAGDVVYPHLPLRHVESERTTKALASMLSALGAAGAETALHSVEHLVKFARANKRNLIAKSVSAVYVAEKLLDGIASAEAEGVEGRVSKATRKMARQVVKILVEMDDEEDDYEEDQTEVNYAQDPNADAVIPVERTKGLDALTTLLDRKPIRDSYTAEQTRRLHSQAQRALLTAVSLQAMACSARILSSSFRTLLLNALYVMLSHVASPQQIIREYASIALNQVAEYVGYDSPQNLVLDNVDYVINVVSQRLTHRRLSSTAPLVLIAMIRLVGQDIVPLVHDVVDEIFDALDDYHGYETLASSLLAVLVTLIEVMAAEVAAAGPSEERVRYMREMRRVDSGPNPQADFELFFKWYEEREERNKERMQEILERAPQHAWGKAEAKVETTGEENTDVPMGEEEGKQPATRSQQVATRILEKSIYFLTHQSPFLRSKVLSLISNAVPVLASGNRESDFLPLIDRSWASILRRLDDKEPYVVTEAAQTIASLCEHAGDFMSKRVLDHAWPRMKILVDTQRELDRKSALARRGAVGTDSRFTVSHRLHLAVLAVATFIASEVPVADTVVWEMIVLFRPFIDCRADGQLQDRARLLYEALGKRDGDAVWTALSATTGGMGEDHGCWGYMRDEALNVATDVEAILAAV
ncbi:hypothetical protein IAU60_002037 [Kwoniella sp. DSM 27419]